MDWGSAAYALLGPQDATYWWPDGGAYPYRAGRPIVMQMARRHKNGHRVCGFKKR